ncbi:MAG: type IV secretion system protein [bacterium]|nr:type IV secretion system protein [bacterium]
MKRLRRNGQDKGFIRRSLKALLVLLLVGASVLSYFPQSAYAITKDQCRDKYGIDGSSRVLPGTNLTPEQEECLRIVAGEINEQEEENQRNEIWETVKEVLTRITGRDGAQAVFFDAKTFDPNEKKNKLDLDGREGKGFKAAEGSVLGDKYNGNPYLVVSSDGHGHTIAGVPEDQYEKIRFVLTEINWAHQPDAESSIPFSGSASQEANYYIFRNEFKPALAISYRTNATRLTGSGDKALGQDERHFVFQPSCEETFSEDAWVSDVDGPGVDDDKYFNGVHLSDTDDEDEIHEVAEKFNNVDVCGSNNSIFAGALKNAMNAIKEAIDAFFDWLKEALLNVINIGTLTENEGLVSAWKTIRDFVNLIFVVIMIVIVFSSILRIDTDRYGVRSLLPRLVFAIIAVNFSFILVQIMTNAAYIISQPFVSKAFHMLANPPVDGSIIDPSGGIGPFFITLLMVIAVALAFVVLFAFFIVRILMIWFLAALSPFVFLFMILPLTRSIASSWWKNAVKWIFMAPVAFMLLYIAAEIISHTSTDSKDINGPDFLLAVAFFIAAAIAAVMIPIKLGGEVMSAARSGARKARQKGWGATKRGGGLAGKAIGATSAGQTAKQMLKQRGALKERAAGRRATEARSRIAGTLGDSRLGQFLTGGEKADVAIARAGEVNEQANALKETGYNRGTLEQIALGNEDNMLSGDEARLAANPIQQEAAAKLLASRGEVYGMQEGGIGHRIFQKHAAAGLHTAMKEQNPALGYADHNGNWDARALENIEGFTGALEPVASKSIYWSDIDKMANHSTKPDERAAGQAAVKGLQPAQVRANLDRSNARTYISNDEERGAFTKLVAASGRPELKTAMEEAEAKNKPPKKPGPNSGAGGQRTIGGDLGS